VECSWELSFSLPLDPEELKMLPDLELSLSLFLDPEELGVLPDLEGPGVLSDSLSIFKVGFVGLNDQEGSEFNPFCC
jgi:hypothetical protein